MMSEVRARYVLIGLACCWLSSLKTANCAEKVFQIDPARSVVTLSGDIVGATTGEQAPGSLTTSLEGTLRVDVTATTIRFLEGSLIDARTNGVWEPLPGGQVGQAPADFGGQGTAVVGPGVGTGVSAAREVQLDVLSDVLPISQEMFDVSTLMVFFPSNAPSKLDYRLTVVVPLFPPVVTNDSLSLTGYATNQVAVTASLRLESGIETMTIPINAEYLLELFTEDSSRMVITGDIVATHTPVEPLVIDISLMGDEVTLRWAGMEGDEFSVEALQSPAAWTTVATNLVPVEGMVTWSTNLDPAPRLFRVRR